MRQIEEPPLNRKRLLLFVGAVLLIITAGGFFLKENVLKNNPQSVKGASTIKPSQNNDNFNKMSSDISGKFQNNLSSIKDEVNNLSVNDVASSSPQVQKVIDDIKALQGYPTSQVKGVCEKICQGL